jgi:hypothetical protein
MDHRPVGVRLSCRRAAATATAQPLPLQASCDSARWVVLASEGSLPGALLRFRYEHLEGAANFPELRGLRGRPASGGSVAFP